MSNREVVVVSGAPGTGKSTIGAALSKALEIPFFSLDEVKEALGDSLGTGDEGWSDRLGDAAAEVVFRLAETQSPAVLEGWWRRERRERVIERFAGALEVFCRCEGQVAERRMRRRHEAWRHPVHRDVINPGILDGHAQLSESVEPLRLGPHLIEVDTTSEVSLEMMIEEVRAALGAPRSGRT